MNGCDNIRARSNGTLKLYLPNPSAQLFSNNAFSANTFSLNVLPSFTAIHSQYVYCEYGQLFYIHLSRKRNISKITSNLLGSNR